MTSPLGLLRIRAFEDGHFEPAPDGQLAAILRVDDDVGELVDLCAWYLSDPGKWWLRHRDEAAFLGSAAVAQAAYYQEALQLASTPEAWIEARRKGACIINWALDFRYIFDGVPRIICDCPALRVRLHDALHHEDPKLVTTGARSVA